MDEPVSGEASGTETDGTEGRSKAVVQEVEHPVFINVLNMIPMAMVSAVVHPIAYYTDKAVEKMTEQLGRLSVRDNKENGGS